MMRFPQVPPKPLLTHDAWGTPTPFLPRCAPSIRTTLSFPSESFRSRRSLWGPSGNGPWTGWLQHHHHGHQQSLGQPVRAARVAHRALVRGIRHSAGSGRLRQFDCNLDHSCSQADENCHQLLRTELGFLWLLHGCLQHPHQLHLRSPRWLVLWRRLLQVPQLLPGHSCVCQYLLHGSDCLRQVGQHKTIHSVL